MIIIMIVIIIVIFIIINDNKKLVKTIRQKLQEQPANNSDSMFCNISLLSRFMLIVFFSLSFYLIA